jgi:hypothetical protein
MNCSIKFSVIINDDAKIQKLPHKQSIVIEKTPTLTSRYQFISGKQLCDKKVNPSWLWGA